MPNDKNDNGVKVKPIMTRNPQANAIVERLHQTIGNMIRTFELYDNDGIDDDDVYVPTLFHSPMWDARSKRLTHLRNNSSDSNSSDEDYSSLIPG